MSYQSDKLNDQFHLWGTDNEIANVVEYATTNVVFPHVLTRMWDYMFQTTYADFLRSEETKGTIAVYVEKVEYRGKTQYYTFIDKTSTWSYRKGWLRNDNDGEWYEYPYEFQQGKAYMLWVEKNPIYQSEIKIISIEECKRKIC